MVRLILTSAALLLAAACTGDEAPRSPDPSQTGPNVPRSPTTASPTAAAQATTPQTLAGVSLSPRSFESEDFLRFFEEAAAVGDAITWSGDWFQLAEEGQAPEATVVLAGRNDLTPIIIASVYDSEDGPLRPLDAANLATYTQKAVDFVSEHDVPYLGLGIEVNVLRERWSADFEAFVALFDATYDAVKAASPQTQVFTVFQLERLLGLHGGLFGGRNDPSLAQWDILDRFANADFFAFTTYPGIVYGTPAEISADHYTTILQHTEKPIAFTEIGWPAVLEVAGWESDEAEQAAFVARFFDLTAALQPRLTIWSFLYDLGLPDPFRGVGLLREDGSPRPAWQAWNEGRDPSP